MCFGNSADATIVSNLDRQDLTFNHGDFLAGGTRIGLLRFWFQRVGTRIEQKLESACNIGLNLRNQMILRVQDSDRALVGLCAIYSGLLYGTSWAERDLSLNHPLLALLYLCPLHQLPRPLGELLIQSFLLCQRRLLHPSTIKGVA